MRPPVEHVRVSAKAKDILIKIKRRTGLEHWNEICRIALCRSLANPAPPMIEKTGESAINIDWKVFAGDAQEELSSIVIYRAQKDGVNSSNKEILSEYFRAHLERGISTLHNTKGLQDLFVLSD